MITVRCSNGVQLVYDETLKPGDIITTYNKGFFEFVKFEDRGPKNSPLAYYIKKFKVGGKPVKSSKIQVCDASYCRKASEKIKEEIACKKKEIILLKKLLKKL